MRVRSEKTFPGRGAGPVRTVCPEMQGPPGPPAPGMAKAEVTGPPGRVSVSSERESERQLLIKTLELQSILKVEILFKDLLPSGFQMSEPTIGMSSYCGVWNR